MRNRNSDLNIKKLLSSFLPVMTNARSLLQCLLLLLLLLPLNGMAQKKKVRLVQAGQMSYDKQRSDVRIVTDEVIFEHDSALLYCDSAVFNELTNHVEAYVKVRIRVNDSLNIYGDELIYEGSTRVALLKGNVRLVDNTTTLETPSLIYDRNSRIASYNEGGHIIDQRNDLTSIRGRYFTPDKQFFFRDSVRLHNKKYDMASDTLHYNTESEVARFFGKTIITSEENTIVCRQGWYDTRNELASFSKKASILMKARVLYGDSLYYNRNIGYGEAFRNIKMIDTERDMIIYGHQAQYKEIQGEAIVTDSALAVVADQNDSLFLHGDTLWALFDSTGETQQLFCYHHVKFYRKDMQGMADSLAYIMKDSLIWMLGKPIMWSGAHQLSADTIRLELANEQVHRIHMRQSSFIASLDDTNAYNQLKGQHMLGFFIENELVKMNIFGNAETVYFVREEDGRLTGINKAVSSDITIRLKDRKIKEIIYYRQPEAILYPASQFPASERRLEGFNWQGHRRPRQSLDVFQW